MAKKRWSSLSPRTRRVLVAGAAVEGALKIVVLNDLRSRPAELVKGPKWAWAAAMVVNSGGILPVAYFLVGRRHAPMTNG